MSEDPNEYPLSYGQRALWFLDRLAPGNPAYIIAGAARISGAVDIAALGRAATALAARHPGLRTTFEAGEPGEPEPRQRVGRQPRVDWVVEDWSAPGEAALALRLSELAYRPFDLARGPLWRLAVLRLAGGGHALALSIHHIVSDFWSLGVMLSELGTLYAQAQGAAGELPPPRTAFREVVEREAASLAGEEGERLWDFWRQALAGVPLVLDLPADHPRPAAPSHRRGAHPVALPPAVAAALGRLTRQRGATLYMGILAAFEVLLHRYSGADRLLVGCPTSGRKSAELAGMVGYLVNPVAIAGDLSGDPPFAELLARLRAAALAAFAHRDFPLPLLAERLQPERAAGRSPIVQVVCVLQKGRRAEEEGLAALAVGEAGGRMSVGPLALTTLAIAPPVVQFDLSLALAETARGLSGRLVYDRDLFAATTAARMVGHLEALLTVLAGAAGETEPWARRLSELPWLPAAERHQVLREWQGGGGDYPGSDLLHELVAAQAARTPEATAVSFAGAWLTHGELAARVAGVAARLAAMGVGPEILVAVCVPRSLAMIVGLLGILQAGGAYLALDPGLPAERLAFLLADARPGALLVTASTAPLLPETAIPCLRVEDFAALRPGANAAIAAGAAGPPSMSPDHPAYVIYTSGSTGKPKGVVIPHRAIATRMRCAVADDLRPGERMIQKTTLAFDVAVFEIFGALLAGGLLVVAPPGAEGDIAAILDLAERHDITRLSFPAPLLALVLAEDSLPPLAALHDVLTGGEAVPPDLPARYYARLRAPLLNRYGPTETSISVTGWRCPPAAARLPRLPIGRPIAVVETFLLDALATLAPLGVPGELAIGGGCLARGYLDRPDLTAERFVPHPFAPVPGSRLYRSGDVVRHLADGAIDFLGRADRQVKVRGFRVELGEIEAALLSHPDVREALVADREDRATGGRRLVAWIVAAPTAAPPLAAAAIQEYLARRLPGYMVPPAIACLAAMPVSPSGKVDRRALPEPAAPAPVAGEGVGEPPRGPVEEMLAAMWADLLGQPGSTALHREDSFFALGGHSLLATQAISRLREALGVEVPLRRLFEEPTLAGFAAVVTGALAGTAAPGEAPPPLLPATPGPGEGLSPLSFAQERLWFLDQLEPGLAAYNMPGAFTLSGRLDRAAFAAALGGVVERHASLRTTFVSAASGEPAQRVAAAGQADLPVVDLSGLPPAWREKTAYGLATDEARRPFDLAHGPLLRAALLALGTDEHRVLVTMHHIVSDGWSVGILVRELGALYAAGIAGRPSPLPALPIQYTDFALWQRRWLAGEVLARQVAWWRQLLAGRPEILDLPVDRPRPAVASLRGGSVAVAWPADLGRRLQALAGRCGATPFMVLLAAFGTLVARLGGQEEVSIGSPVANRNRLETEGLIGFFVNTLVLPVDLAGVPSFSALLAQVRETTLGAYAHQDVPFEKLVAELAPQRNRAYSPLFQVALALQNAPSPALVLPGLTVEPVGVEAVSEKFDCTLALGPSSEGSWRGTLSYRLDLFDRSTVERMAGAFVRLLAAIVSAPATPPGDLPLLGAAESWQLAEWRGGESAYPRSAGLAERFAAQAAGTPEAVALATGGEALSYGELQRQAWRLAVRLQALGVGPEVPVGLLFERSPALVVATLAVLAAGGAYVPLDPAAPAARLSGLLAQTGVKTLVGTAPLLAGLPPHGAHAVAFDGGAETGSTALRGPGAGGDHLAYILFTSGSTGTPKAVAVVQRAVMRLVCAAGYAEFGPGEVFLQLAPASFDAATFEIWGALLHGGRLVVAPAGALTMEELGALLDRHGVTTLWLTAGLFHEMVEHNLGGLAGIRQLLAGGDALSPAHVARLLAAAPETRLINGYGPTEGTTFTTCWTVDRTRWREATVPIGRPIANTTVAVVDAGDRRVPVGVAGELLVGGDGLARGYLGRPEWTAERFRPDPVPGAAVGGRVYRSGDRVRWLADGRLEFLGRLDRQVKIRGFRIEPGEIEAVLSGLPAVRQAVVVVREDRPGEKRLVAYVEVAEAAEVADPGALAELEAALRARLPPYMVPAPIVALAALPLTSNGKVDRQALPAPEWRGASSRVAPRNAVEELLAGLWRELLPGVAQVGVEDSFFHLGGHSLLATRLVSRVRATFGVDVPLRRLFDNPTVAALAALVVAGEAKPGQSEKVARVLLRVKASREANPAEQR